MIEVPVPASAERTLAECLRLRRPIRAEAYDRCGP
jgi:hypothetical protein